jgi:hypothetical protein
MAFDVVDEIIDGVGQVDIGSPAPGFKPGRVGV